MKESKINFSYPIVVFDTETGGLNGAPQIEWDLTIDTSKVGQELKGVVKTPPAPILELAAVVLNPVTLEEEDHFHTYCGPDKGESLEGLINRCDAEALAVNGFDSGDRQESLRNAPPIEQALHDWLKWLRRGTDSRRELHPNRFIPCGQNVRFDIEMLNASFHREGIPYNIQWQPLELIGYSMLYFALPHTGAVARYKLEVVAESLGISTEHAHTALADVRMTAQCLRLFINEFSNVRR
jgi:DNA polymerase III epsilon subunit-like protein